MVQESRDCPCHTRMIQNDDFVNLLYDRNANLFQRRCERSVLKYKEGCGRVLQEYNGVQHARVSIHVWIGSHLLWTRPISRCGHLRSQCVAETLHWQRMLFQITLKNVCENRSS